MFECERVQYNEEQCGLSKCIYHVYNLLLILMTVGLFSYNFSYGVVLHHLPITGIKMYYVYMYVL